MSSQPCGRLGTCTVCHRTDIKLTSTGELHRHGPRSAPCSGGGSTSGGNRGPHLVSASSQARGDLNLQSTSASALLNSTRTTLPKSTTSGLVSTQVDGRATQQAVATLLTTSSQPSVLSTNSSLLLPDAEHSSILGGNSWSSIWLEPVPPLVKWIPRSARRSCATLLTELLQHVVNHPTELEGWQKLLLFPRAILGCPAIGQQAGNLSNTISRRCAAFRNGDVQLAAATQSNFKGQSLHQRNVDAEMVRLAREVSAKLEEGNYRGAVRRLCSNESVAQNTPETIQSLKLKHPDAPNDRRIAQQLESAEDVLQVGLHQVRTTIFSFPCGSSGGLDGLLPQHLKDLIRIEGESSALLLVLTAFVNLILSGQMPPAVRDVFFGGRLIALKKKDGGIRPIAIGCTLRRLVSKIASQHASHMLKEYFGHLQVGVGVSNGMEATVHSVRRYTENLQSGHVVVKLDFKNAFNSIRRDVILEAVKQQLPSLYPLVFCAYASATSLVCQGSIIVSAEGVQQGDPLGPILFCLALHPLLQRCQTELSVAYLDDVTLGGTVDEVASEVLRIRQEGAQLGILLNDAKCEVIGLSPDYVRLPVSLENFKKVDGDKAVLLGSPLLSGSSVHTTLQDKVEALEIISSRLSYLQAHDALTVLRHSLSLPSLLHILRTAKCLNHPLLYAFDEQLRQCLSDILNVSLDDKMWIQASLPIKAGGLGIRRVVQVAPSAFLASHAATRCLVAAMLPTRLHSLVDQSVDDAISTWKGLGGEVIPTGEFEGRQRKWDGVLIEYDRQQLLAQAQDLQTEARLRAVMSSHAGDWLSAPPLSAAGLRMDNNTIRVATALRLGAPVCAPHKCVCGNLVDARGIHGLSCTRSAGRSSRHHQINDIIHRALNHAHVAAVKEPSGLIPGCGLRPDGSTTVPWQRGKCLVWDATVPDTLAPSHLQDTASIVGAAAAAAALLKHQKYAALEPSYIVMPVAVETFGAWDSEGMGFITTLGRRLSAVTGDPKETKYLFQRISVAIQRGNALSCLSSLLQQTG